LRPNDATSHCIKLVEQCAISRSRRRDDRVLERPI
jgi:hypothetical protein